MTGLDIRNARIKLNLTQRELAAITGFSYVAISRWETGKVKPIRANMILLEKIISEQLNKTVK